MARKIKKKDVDRELLESIYVLETEWKQIRDLSSKSYERTFETIAAERIAEAKYLYLLREARRRDVSALRI